jgi:hypothetical protein
MTAPLGGHPETVGNTAFETGDRWGIAIRVQATDAAFNPM